MRGSHTDILDWTRLRTENKHEMPFFKVTDGAGDGDGGWGIEQRIVIKLELSATVPFVEAQVGLKADIKISSSFFT